MSYFQAEHKNIGNLFDEASNKVRHSDPTNPFYYLDWVVPNYQRKYSWKDDHLNDFWEDLNSNQETFFGTFLMKIPKDRLTQEELPHNEIIDGQQRLTTMTIMWGVITNILEELKSITNLPNPIVSELTEQVVKYEQKYLVRPQIRNSQNTNNYYFYLHEEQEAIFQNFIKDRNTTHEILTKKYNKNTPEWKLQNAYFFFFRKFLGLNEGDSSNNAIFNLKDFKELSDNNKKSYEIDDTFFRSDSKYKLMLTPPFTTNSADTFLEFIEDTIEIRFRDLMSVIITIKDESLAFEYFESVNAKGEDLSVADLLKNLVLKNISNLEERNTVEGLWNQTINRILDFDDSNNAIIKFFRYYWTSKHGYVTTKQLYKSIKDATSTYDSDEWIKFAEDILYFSEIYSNLLDKEVLANDFKPYFIPKRSLHDKVFRSINGLRATRTQLWTVIAMTLISNRHYFNRIPNGSDTVFFPYEDVFDVIEKFIFSYSVATKGASNWIWSFVDDFSRTLRTWKSENKNWDKVQSELRSEFYDKINNKIPFREEFKKGVKENIKYNSKNIPLCHYYLHEIERIKFNAPITSQATVEHIIPKTPKKWNLKAKQVPRLHHIGNLIFLEYRLNSGSAGNETFDNKITTYEESNFKQIEDFLSNYNTLYNFSNITVDDMEAVENRDEVVAEQMAEIWIDKLNTDTSR